MPFFDTQISTLDQLYAVDPSTRLSVQQKGGKNVLVAKGSFSNFLDRFLARFYSQQARQARIQTLNHIRDTILSRYDPTVKELFNTNFFHSLDANVNMDVARSSSLIKSELNVFFEDFFTLEKKIFVKKCPDQDLADALFDNQFNYYKSRPNAISDDASKKYFELGEMILKFKNNSLSPVVIEDSQGSNKTLTQQEKIFYLNQFLKNLFEQNPSISKEELVQTFKKIRKSGFLVLHFQNDLPQMSKDLQSSAGFPEKNQAITTMANSSISATAIPPDAPTNQSTTILKRKVKFSDTTKVRTFKDGDKPSQLLTLNGEEEEALKAASTSNGK